MDFQSIFSRRMSSLLSLLLVMLLATAVGAWIISEAQKLKELQKPVPFYIADFVEEQRNK